ncbi:MAG TPA: pyridoxal-phosphate dependent enzyme [Streptosporangiaceae bacterium]|jgi:cysteine synthase A
MLDHFAFDHIADAQAGAGLIRLSGNLYVLRFEAMKVASALGAVGQLMSDGRITPGDTLVDSSSGIYAYSLALACHKYGFRCHIVASPSVDLTLKTQLELLGATVEQPATSHDACFDQAARVDRVIEYVKDHPRAHWMGQYHDQVHYAGYRPVARDVAACLAAPRGMTLVCAVGTGASSGGLATALAALGVRAWLVGMQPFGSVSFGSGHIEDPRFLISGTGSGMFFANIDYSLYREIHWIGFDYARAGCIGLMREHGIFAGLSSGAAYLAARWAAGAHGRGPDGPVVFVAPDTGHRYVTEVFASADPVVSPDPAHPIAIARQAQLRLPWCWTDWAANSAAFTVPEPDQAGGR